MESVIDKLSEIETAASRIMESAVEETRRQDNAAEERTSTYDNDTDAQAARTLEAAKRTLQEQADRELEHLKTSTDVPLSTWMLIIRNIKMHYATRFTTK